jgi:hypothetical protein
MVNFQAATLTSTDFIIRLSAALWDKSFALGGIENPLHIRLPARIDFWYEFLIV